jgi:hypothetical protein
MSGFKAWCNLLLILGAIDGTHIIIHIVNIIFIIKLGSLHYDINSGKSQKNFVNIFCMIIKKHE